MRLRDSATERLAQCVQGADDDHMFKLHLLKFLTDNQ